VVEDYVCGGGPKLTRTEVNIAAVADLINALNAEFNPICYLLALLGAHIFYTLAG